MVVVITGASAGIGQALARLLAIRGARLVLAARRLERLEDLNRALGGSHLVVQTDVSKPDECRSLIDRAAQHFGRIDTLVCNAGYGIYQSVEATSPQQMRDIFATNFFGTTDCIHFAVPVMLRQGVRDGYRGQVMIVSSSVARRAIVFMGAYCATKAAQLSIAEALRVELMPCRIAVTSVHPIQTGTEFGRVAEAAGHIRMPASPVRQPVELVARKMVRAIERPVAELWPYAAARWAFGLGTLVPGLVDRMILKYRQRVLRENPDVPF
jgi:short-subunit dehydrogenase